MRRNFYLILILAFAFLLRVWQINLIPFGFTPDEASFGYDAYSILKTGRDQWGHLLPLTLESFGDFKPALYSYLTIPSVAIFGLNVFATRLPNALVGTLAVLASYLLAKELRKYSKLEANIKHFNLETLVSFMLAISPWHIMMSRGAFEANITTFLMPLGIYFFLVGLKKNRYLIFSAFILGLNLFSYHSARLVTPLLLLTLILLFRKELVGSGSLQKAIYNFKLPILVFGVMAITAAFTLFSGAARRAEDISIFSGAVETASDNRLAYLYQGLSPDTARIFLSKYHIIAERFFENCFQYFSHKFLFLDGPAEATYGMIPGRGVLYWFELPFILMFVYMLSRSTEKRGFILLLLWVLIAVIPAALASGRGYSANRAVIMLPALTIMSSIGALAIYSQIVAKINYKLLNIGITVIAVYSFTSFFINYFLVSPFNSAKDMLWGNLQMAYWLDKNVDSNTNVIVSRSLSEPHIYIAFASVWNPKDYQRNSVNWLEYKKQNLKFVDQMEEYKLGKYTFSSIDYKSQSLLKDTIIAGRPDEFPVNVKPYVNFVIPSGETRIQIVNPFSELYAKSNEFGIN